MRETRKDVHAVLEDGKQLKELQRAHQKGGSYGLSGHGEGHGEKHADGPRRATGSLGARAEPGCGSKISLGSVRAPGPSIHLQRRATTLLPSNTPNFCL